MKRLKVLEKEGYIKRENYYFIKLDSKGKELVKKLGYEYIENCRNKEYKNRMKNISRIATLTINSNIEFIPSWNLKNKEIFTETARKYIGEANYNDNKYLVYYIDKTKDWIYERQIISDIKKSAYYKNFIIFLDDLNRINKKNRYFIMGKSNTYIIVDSIKNIENTNKIINYDFYELISNIYTEELLLSNWKDADYMIGTNKYIIIMPFINTEKLYRINIFLRNNENTCIDFITFKENNVKIKEIIKYSCNLINIDGIMEGWEI